MNHVHQCNDYNCINRTKNHHKDSGTIARLCAATDCKLILVGELGFSLDDKYCKARRVRLLATRSMGTCIKSTSDYISHASGSNPSILGYLATGKVQKHIRMHPLSTYETFIFGSET